MKGFGCPFFFATVIAVGPTNVSPFHVIYNLFQQMIKGNPSPRGGGASPRAGRRDHHQDTSQKLPMGIRGIDKPRMTVRGLRWDSLFPEYSPNIFPEYSPNPGIRRMPGKPWGAPVAVLFALSAPREAPMAVLYALSAPRRHRWRSFLHSPLQHCRPRFSSAAPGAPPRR